jgi:hypothetical protein
MRRLRRLRLRRLRSRVVGRLRPWLRGWRRMLHLVGRLSVLLTIAITFDNRQSRTAAARFGLRPL